MNTCELLIPNANHQEQAFIAEIGDDGIKLLKYMTNNIAHVYLPDKVKGKTIIEVGEDCFFAHSEIETIVLPQELQKIGTQSFAMCKNLTEINLPDTITEIDSFAFRDSNKIKKLNLPAKLRCLNTSVFSFCQFPDDAEIILNDGLEIIKAHAFYSSGFITLKIPKSVRIIENGAFSYGMKIITDIPINEDWFE